MYKPLKTRMRGFATLFSIFALTLSWSSIARASNPLKINCSVAFDASTTSITAPDGTIYNTIVDNSSVTHINVSIQVGEQKTQNVPFLTVVFFHIWQESAFNPYSLGLKNTGSASTVSTDYQVQASTCDVDCIVVVVTPTARALEIGDTINYTYTVPYRIPLLDRCVDPVGALNAICETKTTQQQLRGKSGWFLSAVVSSTIATGSMPSEWNCGKNGLSNAYYGMKQFGLYGPVCGSFIQTQDCTLPGSMVMAAGELNITGQKGLTTVRVPMHNRHFTVVAEFAILRLKWLKLTGSNIASVSPEVMQSLAAFTGGKFETDTGGSILLSYSARLFATECWFHENVAKRGGGIAVSFEATAILVDSNITHNIAVGETDHVSQFTATGGIGGILGYNVKGNGQTEGGIKIFGGEISHNAAFKDTAGGLYCKDIRCECHGVVIKNNTATHGGGLIVEGSQPLILNNVLFESNKATGYTGTTLTSNAFDITFPPEPSEGGGMKLVTATSVALNNVIFKENNASAGGGIHITGASTSSNFDQVIFLNNTASSKGGALYATQGVKMIHLSRTNFSGNKAPRGNDVYSTSVNVLLLDIAFEKVQKNLVDGTIKTCTPSLCRENNFGDSGVGCVNRPHNLGVLCIDCAPGRSLSRDADASTCEACAPGFFAAESKQAFCTRCAPGKYQSHSGGVSCTECEKGKYSNTSSTCYDIPQGFHATNCINTSASTGCSAVALNGIVFEWPIGGQSVTEGGTLSYQIGMNRDSPPSLPVTVTISVVDGPCTVSPFRTSYLDSQPVTIQVTTVNDNRFSALDSVAYVCVLNHTLSTNDIKYKAALNPVVTLSILSKGCGRGEFLGPYERKHDGTECICAKNYFLSHLGSCDLCPRDSSICDRIGLKAPIVAKSYWRFDPTSPNLVMYPFYKCPQAKTCLGGNSTLARCTEGYANDGPLCMTCKAGHTLSGGSCISCPGRTSTNEFAPELLIVSIIMIVFLGVISYWYLTAPAITDKDMEFLKRVLNHGKLKNRTSVRRQSFINIVRDHSASFNTDEINQAFDKVDEDGSGNIDQGEINKWLGENKFDEIAANVQGCVDVADAINMAAPNATKVMWSALSSRFEVLERIVKEGRKALEQLRPQFLGNELWPFDGCELSLTQMHQQLLDILRSFVKYLDDPAYLHKQLNAWLLRLYILLIDLSPAAALPTLTLPGWDEFIIRWDSLWAPLDGIKLGFKDLICLEWPELSRSIALNAPKLLNGNWLMTLKIFIGSSQCFCYFAITFDVPWPQSLLAFMQILELTSLDFYAVLGNISCIMQTGYLQKFRFHMLLFPCVVGVVGLAYLFARRTRLRKEYTNDSLKTQFITLIFLISFTLYTGVTTRLFRLFKCEKVQDKWYLSADYMVDCNSTDYYAHSAIAYVCIFLFVIGLPLFEFIVLWRNRTNLYSAGCKDPVRQRKLEKELGSIYAHYHPHAYLFDVLDLLRRVLLTGALIMMGNESVAQVFLGIVICIAWLCILLLFRPYRDKWDNIVAVVLAAHLSFTLVSGMALKLYETTPDQDEYQTAGFEIVLLLVSYTCIAFSIVAILLRIPFVQTLLSKLQQEQNRESLKTIKKRPTVTSPETEMRWIANPFDGSSRHDTPSKDKSTPPKSLAL